MEILLDKFSRAAQIGCFSDKKDHVKIDEWYSRWKRNYYILFNGIILSQ